MVMWYLRCMMFPFWLERQVIADNRRQDNKRRVINRRVACAKNADTPARELAAAMERSIEELDACVLTDFDRHDFLQIDKQKNPREWLILSR